jgi:hypothetical protein
MQPRIYTYKVTFEEIPDWYWGVHKEQKYGETYLGSPKTHAWKWDFYTPHLQICELFPNTDEGWAQARKVEDSCILPDLDNLLCLNEHVGGLRSLVICRKAGKAAHEKKDDLGRSIIAMNMNGTIHKERDDMGRSIYAMNKNGILHKERDENGMSLFAVEKCGRPRKAIVVTFPDGSQQSFNSIRETARFLGIGDKAVRQHIGKGPSGVRGKLFGYRFKLAKEM